MKETSIKYHFEVLGLKPNSTLGEVKEAYKDLVKVWHPDRFSHDIKLQAKAQEKLKQINEAYEKIKNYKPEKSAIPKKETKSRSPRKTNSQSRTSTRKKTEETKSHSKSSAESKRQSEDNKKSKPNVNNNHSASTDTEENYSPFKNTQETIKHSSNFSPIFWAIVVIIGLAIFFIYKNRSQDNKNTVNAENINNKSTSESNSINSLAISSNEQLIAENISNQSNTNLKQKEISNSDTNENNNVIIGENENTHLSSANDTEPTSQTSQSVILTPQILAEQNKNSVQSTDENISPKQERRLVFNKGFFTIGSTKDDVLIAQGTPKSITGNTFGYDYSTVYFQNDRVIGWSNISRNLRVKMYSNSSTTESYFTVGSTKDDVIKIQGTPDNITGNTFGYGYSTVYFQNNQVKSWSNISNNLKVILKPKQ